MSEHSNNSDSTLSVAVKRFGTKAKGGLLRGLQGAVTPSKYEEMAEPQTAESPTGPARTLQYTRRGLKMVGEKSLFDINEPIWHPDEKSPACDRCSAPFSLLNRRHHCRRCGDVICGDCCERAPLGRMGYVDPVLVCKKCAPACKMEEEFLTIQLKLLVEGASFHLSDSEDATMEYHCHLSPDHKYIVISNDHLPINMKHILEVKTHQADHEGDTNESSPAQGRKKRGGSHGHRNIKLELVYKSGGAELKLILSPISSHRKHSTDWLKALKKGLVILHK